MCLCVCIISISHGCISPLCSTLWIRLNFRSASASLTGWGGGGQTDRSFHWYFGSRSWCGEGTERRKESGYTRWRYTWKSHYVFRDTMQDKVVRTGWQRKAPSSLPFTWTEQQGQLRRGNIFSGAKEINNYPAIWTPVRKQWLRSS